MIRKLFVVVLTVALFESHIHQTWGEGLKYTFFENGQKRNYEWATNEFLLKTKENDSGAQLDRIIRGQFSQAVVLQKEGGTAFIKVGRSFSVRKAQLSLVHGGKRYAAAELAPVLYLLGFPDKNEINRRIVTKDILIKAVDYQTGQLLVKETRPISMVPTLVSNLFQVNYSNAFDALDAAIELSREGVEAAPLLSRRMFKRSIPNDKMYTNQWHLHSTGQNGAQPGMDVNVEPAWDSVTGQGVTISIIDDGLQTKHPDLRKNAAKKKDGLHYNYNNGRAKNPNPKKNDGHGTSCGGVAAAIGNNKKGVVGAAYQARLVGRRLISSEFTPTETADALLRGSNEVDVASNSWGPSDDGKIVDEQGPSFIELAALQTGVTLGRNGQGMIFTWAGGNGRDVFVNDSGETQGADHSNYDGYANSRYVIAVGACDDQGEQSFYSEGGANLAVCAPSNGGKTPGITTVDVTGKRGYKKGAYIDNFSGTSSACPLVAGVTALMLEKNPNLGWRDVKEILLRTATTNGLVAVNPVGAVNASSGNEVFVTNGAGFHFSHSYGAGRVDAAAAVTMAATWTNLGSEISIALATNLSVAIPDNNAGGVICSFDFPANPAIRVETVEFTVNVTGGNRGDLVYTLSSPSGMNSIVPRRVNDDGAGLTNWKFSTVRHWGESSVGTWTLYVADLAIQDIATLQSVTVQIYGTSF